MRLLSKRMLSTVMAATLVTANLVDGGSIGRAFASVTTETGAEVHQDANEDRSVVDVNAGDSRASVEQRDEADTAEGQDANGNMQGADAGKAGDAAAEKSKTSVSGDPDVSGKEDVSAAEREESGSADTKTAGGNKEGSATNSQKQSAEKTSGSVTESKNETLEKISETKAESQTEVSESTAVSADENTASAQETTAIVEGNASQETAASETTTAESGVPGAETTAPEISVSETTVPETIVPETTAAAHKEIHVTFHVVDDLGNEISEKYDDVKVHFDRDGVLTLDQKDKAPVRSIRRQTGSMLAGLIKFYSKKYSYQQATINGEVIRAIRKSNADGVTVYEYTIDGENWTALDEDTEVLLVYARPESDARLYAEYLEEGRIKVTVELHKELPDGVELKVQELTPEEDNYDAYMTALADSARASESDLVNYSQDNTLLYDISFIGTDEDGNPYEYQPEEDVSVKVEFLGGQLSQELGAAHAGDVEIRHLPVKEEVKARAAEDGERTTSDLTDLAAEDILVEPVKDANVTIDNTAAKTEEEDAAERKDTATFSVPSFCIFSFKNEKQTDGTYWEGDNPISVDSFIDKLGVASKVAIYADTLENHLDHLEGSIAVNKFWDYGNNKLNEADRLQTRNKVEEIEIQKTVDTVSENDRNFTVRFYQDQAASSPVGNPVVITIKKKYNIRVENFISFRDDICRYFQYLG